MMKNSGKWFITVEAALAVMIIILAVMMFREKNGKDFCKVSVIVQNSDDNQWNAFKYGLKMAAEEQKMELFIASTAETLTAEEEISIINQEIENGARAVIVQPAAGNDMQSMLKKIQKKVPVLLAGCALPNDNGAAQFATVEPDHYAMGRILAEELLKDYNGNIAGKTLGIASDSTGLTDTDARRKGFEDGLKDTGVKICWSVYTSSSDAVLSLGKQPKTDFVAALDDKSLNAAGECAAANNLHGALVYGIGNSMEAVYYLDTGAAECLIVPDDFSMGYQSMYETAQKVRHRFYQMKDRNVSYTVLRAEELFTEKNQEILFTMSQ